MGSCRCGGHTVGLSDDVSPHPLLMEHPRSLGGEVWSGPCRVGSSVGDGEVQVAVFWQTNDSGECTQVPLCDSPGVLPSLTLLDLGMVG